MQIEIKSRKELIDELLDIYWMSNGLTEDQMDLLIKMSKKDSDNG